MTTKTLTRKVFAEINTAAHRAAYAACSMFLEKHSFTQGRKGTGLFIKHGFSDLDENHVQITELVVGERLKNKHALPQVSALSIPRLLRQSFVGNQAWLVDDVQVSVKRFMEPVTRFLMEYESMIDVFAGIYENKYTNTNVLGIFIMLKDMEDEAKRLSWEITIDDVDLIDALAPQQLFFA